MQPAGAGAAYLSGAYITIPAIALQPVDRCSNGNACPGPAYGFRRSVCELSSVRMRGKVAFASTPSPGVHTQPSPRANWGRAARVRWPSTRSAWPSIQRPTSLKDAQADKAHFQAVLG